MLLFININQDSFKAYPVLQVNTGTGRLKMEKT